MRARVLVPAVCAALVAWSLALAAGPAAAQAPDARAQKGGTRPRFTQTPEEKEADRVRLGITKEQQNHIESVHAELDQKRKDLADKLWEQYRKLGTLYSSYEIDEAQTKVVRREIVSLHRRILDLHAENEQRIRRILTKDQFERFQALMKERFDKMGRGGGPRRGGPNPGPGGGGRP